MYRIGDFSRITGITVKALRYYDEQGILLPCRRDDNGYRYYDAAAIETARIVALLREMDFGIAEIQDVMHQYEDKQDLSYFLQNKVHSIQRRIQRDQRLVQRMEQLIQPMSPLHHPVPDVTIQSIDPIRVASMRVLGAYADTGIHQATLYKALRGQASGDPFNLYHTYGYADEVDMEICVPTTQSIRHRDITIQTLPVIHALTTVYTGPYDAIGIAYQALIDYAQQAGLEHGLPTREIYRKGPGMLFMGNPNKYVTEIQIPIQSHH